MDESTTRKEIIDKQLLAAHWDVADRTQVISEWSIEVEPRGVKEPDAPYAGRQFSDYVLLGKDGQVLAVVEAKRTSKDAALGREQAKQYCYNIQKERGGELPFCFYTNGHEIFFWNLEQAPPKKVFGFPTRDDLERYQYLRKNKKPLFAELINTRIAGRDYQIQAIRSVMEAIEQKRTKFLLVMATGTGKTRTTIALVDALMRAGWAEKTLFLVDRIALRNQTLDAFKEHLPDEPRWPNAKEKTVSKSRRIYVSTYPAMLNIIKNEELSPHFFDLVVVDESHRSIYNTYAAVLNYFNTITLGLTATPTDVIDHNTFKLFNCEDGIPTFAYSYEEAVQHLPPYLCNFQVMKLQTKFQEEGISQRTISLEEQKRLIQEGRAVEEINFEGSELEQSVINRGTNVTIVKEFMEECIKDPDGVLPGKSIFFCMTISHARRMEQIFNDLYPEYNGELARVLTSDDSRVYGKGGLLDQFTNHNFPRVAISVDMLDTGIDVRELVNLVFAKPVYSYTKFWQMIGRGTRLLEPEKMKPWCPEKDVFLILDCWNNFSYFKLQPKGRTIPPQIPLPVRYVGLRLDKIAAAFHLNETAILEKEWAALRSQIQTLPAKSIFIQEARKELATVAKADFWKTFTEAKITVLRQSIKPLFRVVSGVDFKALRFRKDALETSLAHLRKEAEQLDLLKINLQNQVAELPTTINLVAQHQTFIDQVLSIAYWETITDTDFDDIADRLAPLMKFRTVVGPFNEPVKLDIKDVVQTKEMVEFGPQNEAVSIARYREMVEERINALLEQHPILQQIKAGKLVEDSDIAALAQQLNDEDPHITEELLKKVYKNRSANFIQFIKHILGIELLESFEEQVNKEVQHFIQGHSYLSTRQIDFLNLLKNYILQRGSIERKNLIEAPFTVMHPKGVRGLFTPQEIQEILTITEKFAA